MTEIAASAPKTAAVRGWRWGAAETVVATAAGLIGILVVIVVLLNGQGSGVALQQERNRARDGADRLAVEAQWVIGGLHAFLAQLASGAATPADLADGGKARLDPVLAALPGSVQFGIYDATGNAWAGAGTASLPESIADSDYFAALEAGGDWTISGQLTDAASGAPMFVIAQRLGTELFGGVAVAVVPSVALADVQAAMGTGAMIGLVRTDGRLIAEQPAAAPHSIAVEEMQQLTRAEAGTYVSTATATGDAVTVTGFRQLTGLPLIARVTIASAGTTAGTSALLLLLVPATLALAGLAGLAAWSLKRRRPVADPTSRPPSASSHIQPADGLQRLGMVLQLQPIPREIKADMAQRIEAVSALQALIAATPAGVVPMRETIHKLIEQIHKGSGLEVKLVEELEDIAVERTAAMPLGLILNEAVANAFKHAFPGEHDGEVTIQLATHDGKLWLVVEDNGVGFDPERPAKGSGRRLITALTEELGGESGFVPGPVGSRFALNFPLGAGSSGAK